MASETWNEIDQFAEEFPCYYCIFLDILGYKEKAGQYFEGKYNLYGRISRAMERASIANTLTASMTNAAKAQVEIFSDSIIILQPDDGMGCGGILLFASIFCSNLSFEDLLVRGGMGYGKHIKKRTFDGLQFTASEALQSAYLLESDHARNPRVLISPEVIQRLRREEYSLLITENKDYILHFANYVINRDGLNEDFVYKEMEDLQFAMDRSASISVKEKYQWLLDYYCWAIRNNEHMNSSRFSRFESQQDRQFSFLSHHSD